MNSLTTFRLVDPDRYRDQIIGLAGREDAVPAPAAPDIRWPNLYLAVLDEVNYGLILVRRDGEVLFANRAARRECGPEQPLQIEANHLALRSNGEKERMTRALADACNGRRSMVDLGTLEQRACVAVVPLSTGCTQPPAALLILGRNGTADALALQLFAKVHQLTPAESSVLSALSEGLRPAQIASQHGVAVCTVRTQIRSIRQKTLTRSIGHLVHLIERLPPMALSVSPLFMAHAA